MSELHKTLGFRTPLQVFFSEHKIALTTWLHGKEMTIMKKLCFSLVFALVFLSAASGIKAQSQISAFTGTWVLDREKTPSKNLPLKLKDYKMLVGESENLLHVKSQVEGPVDIVVARDRGASSSEIVSSSDNRTTRPGANGVSASSSVAVAAEKNDYGGTLALYFTANEATYNLSGEEQKVEIKQGEKVNGIARIRAKLDKNGKSLQFTTIRRMRTAKGEMEITNREWWKISEDGKSLRLQRTVDTPTARDEITMVLAKTAQ
jgi:hypothetical protein